jgi:hypothetical protein
MKSEQKPHKHGATKKSSFPPNFKKKKERKIKIRVRHTKISTKTQNILYCSVKKWQQLPWIYQFKNLSKPPQPMMNPMDTVSLFPPHPLPPFTLITNSSFLVPTSCFPYLLSFDFEALNLKCFIIIIIIIIILMQLKFA